MEEVASGRTESVPRCWQPPHPGKLPQKPFLLGVRSEGPQEPGWGHRRVGRAATGSQGAAAQEETHRAPRNRRRTRRQRGWAGTKLTVPVPRCWAHSFRGAPAPPQPQGIQLSSATKMNPSQGFTSRLVVPVGASVVGERVPQEDEDEDDAGGRQGRAGDVEEPSGLGVLHRSVQVVEKFLVPNLKPEGGGETSSRRRGVDTGSGQAGGREGMRAEGP